MHQLLQDFRFTVRQWRKSPGFALTTILTLALGIGATTAIFSLVNAVLLRPLPFSRPDRLAYVAERPKTLGGAQNESQSGNLVLSYPDFFDWRAQNHSFENISGYHDNDYTLTGAGDPKHLYGQIVSAEFFRVLGVKPLLGRGFIPDDEKPGVRVVVLSHQLWKSSFNAAPDIVGHAVTLDNRSYTVIGVMPEGFNFPIQNPASALWTSLADDAVDPGGDEPPTKQRGMHTLDTIARLKPGVSVTQAQADLSVIARNLAQQYPDSNKRFDAAAVIPELDYLVGDTRPALHVLFASVAFVLLIACVNVAGLLLARTSRRSTEMAIRSALGAKRTQILRQVLFESVLLSLVGGFLGVVLSIVLLRGVLHLVPGNLPRLDQVSVDINVLVFATAISVLTGILFGVLPAWRMSRLDPSMALRDGARSLNRGRGQHRLHDSLVIAETAIGLVLLIGAGLLIHSFIRILHVDAGFDPHNVLTASLALPDNRYNGQQQVQFYNQLLPHLEALPGVQSVAAGWTLPYSRNGMRIAFEVEGRPLPPGERPAAGVYVVTPNFFHTLRIPIVRGRAFRPEDTAKSTSVVIVNETFARKYFPNEDAVGKRLQIGLGDGTVNSKSMREIVGVVADVRNRKLTTQAAPEYYLPYAQAAVLSPNLIIRTAGDPVSLIGAVRAQLAQMDKTVPLYEIKTMDDIVSQASAHPRFQTLVITMFAAMALLLSSVGLYAVLSYMVTQRTLEIGLRMAVGAQRSDVLKLVLRRGLTLAAIGLGIGLVISLVLTRFLQGMLYGVRPFDPLTVVAVSLVLLLVSLIASSAPAYRAARLDPMNTLREQ